MTKQHIIHGDSLIELKRLPDNSVDSVVTDPPYELSFMGKKWDGSGIAYNVQLWSEVYRVLKPGGHLLAFGGTRTSHRMTVAIEDAGFEIRDSIAWVYAQGFPKSMDISKAIDKAAGVERTVTREVSESRGSGSTSFDSRGSGARERRDIPSSEDAKKWSGYGTALKPSIEPITVARKPLSEKTVAANVLKWGTGGLNIDGSRIGTDTITTGYRSTDRTGHVGKFGLGDGADTQHTGRFPANVILGHTEECVLVGETTDSRQGGARTSTFGDTETVSGGNGTGTFPARSTTTEVYECVEGCVVKEMDRQSGVTSGTYKAPNARVRKNAADWMTTRVREGTSSAPDNYGDTGGASRFFYVAKPGKSERPVHEDGTLHPTVKPLKLMRYLVRLVTPAGGTVLDPFAGSGTTVEAAILEGFDSVGIELTEEYISLIHQRITRATVSVPEPVKKAGKRVRPIVNDNVLDGLETDVES